MYTVQYMKGNRRNLDVISAVNMIKKTNKGKSRCAYSNTDLGWCRESILFDSIFVLVFFFNHRQVECLFVWI